MATAIKLGNRPKIIIKTIEFSMVDPDTGIPTTGRIACHYKYRTQTEFGAWLDAKAKTHGLDAAAIGSNHDLYERVCTNSAESILDVLDGWDIPDQALSPATAFQLIDEVPAAGIAILTGYREAITEGRLGN